MCATLLITLKGGRGSRAAWRKVQNPFHCLKEGAGEIQSGRSAVALEKQIFF